MLRPIGQIRDAMKMLVREGGVTNFVVSDELYERLYVLNPSDDFLCRDINKMTYLGNQIFRQSDLLKLKPPIKEPKSRRELALDAIDVMRDALRELNCNSGDE
jgi:hypothetical protein